MSTVTRPELSEKNKFWIEKHRYYELKHFCLQYPIWKKARAALTGLASRPQDLERYFSGKHSDPTAKCAEARLFYTERMELVENAARATDEELAVYILMGVTDELSYDHLRATYDIPCCKEVYYRLYRKFFWLLNKTRG